ncbi:MAG TPA: hypothetical protein VH834_06030 [Solirubrobacteraceae bacterium]|jgi:hypothetical protein
MTVGLEPLRLDGHIEPPSELPADPARAELPGLIERLGDGDGRLLVVVPTWSKDSAQRRLDVVRSALAGRRQVVRMDTDLPPLGAAVLAGLAASLAPGAPSTGLLIDGLRLLEAELVLLAALPSVLRLRRPRPGFGQRVRSLFPGGRFLVRAQPDPLVVSLRRNGEIPDLLGEADSDRTAVVIGGRTRGAEWQEHALTEALPAASLTRVAGEGDAGRRWGVSQALEAVAYPTDREALIAELFSVASFPCPWCDEPVTSVPCPVCGHDRNRALQEALS